MRSLYDAFPVPQPAASTTAAARARTGEATRLNVMAKMVEVGHDLHMEGSRETAVVNIVNRDLDEVIGHHRAGRLESEVELLLAQVVRPRFNIGNSGPPGRAD